MQLLRRVHLVDPLQSPSWSGVQRSTQENSSVLHLIVKEACKSPNASELLQPGIVNLTSDPNILVVRGLLLDTIKHVGPVLDQYPTDRHSYKPPKWLVKLAITNNSAALREVPLNIAANTMRNPTKPRASPQKALQEKYDEFMTSIFTLVDIHNAKAPPKAFFADIRMCVTEAGYFGLVPPSTRTGDNIFMVERDALKSLFVVRKHPVHGFFLWNGLIYVHYLAEAVSNLHATDRIVIG